MQPSAPPYLDHPGPIALAHRGFAADGLENTFAAFRAAVELGYRYVETDVHATADGVALALHDASLDRVTDSAGRVAALPWVQVRRARVGGVEPVPRLDDLLDAWPALRVNLDVKSVSAIGPTVEVIERLRAHDRVCIASFSDARRRAVVGRLSRPVVTSAGNRTVAAFLLAARRGSPAAVRRALRDVQCLQLPERQGRITVVTARTVAAAHAAGVQVHVWTVDAPGAMNRLLDLGVDGLVTNRADLLRDVLRARSQWPEPDRGS